MEEKVVDREFPKHLYLNGDRNAADKIVKDVAEEEAGRAEGYRMIGDPEPAAKKNGKKAAE